MKLARSALALAGALAPFCLLALAAAEDRSEWTDWRRWGFDRVVRHHANRQIEDGRRIFRNDTFGDEAFWGDALRLHEGIEGAGFGGVGPGVSPRTALAVGLKVDVDHYDAFFGLGLAPGEKGDLAEFLKSL